MRDVEELRAELVRGDAEVRADRRVVRVRQQREARRRREARPVVREQLLEVVPAAGAPRGKLEVPAVANGEPARVRRTDRRPGVVDEVDPGARERVRHALPVEPGSEAPRRSAAQRDAIDRRERQREARQERVEVARADVERDVVLPRPHVLDDAISAVDVAGAVRDVDEVRVAPRVPRGAAVVEHQRREARGLRREIRGAVAGREVRRRARAVTGQRVPAPSAALHEDQQPVRARVEVHADARGRAVAARAVGERHPGPGVGRCRDRLARRRRVGREAHEHVLFGPQIRRCRCVRCAIARVGACVPGSVGHAEIRRGVDRGDVSATASDQRPGHEGPPGDADEDAHRPIMHGDPKRRQIPFTLRLRGAAA